MCALFGWLDYKHIVQYKVLKKLTQALANAAEERGTDATGISHIRDGQVVIYKRPKPAHKIHFNAPDGTTAIMGHTRLTTQGNQKFNQNNHPFSGHADKEFSFAHNGVVNYRLKRKQIAYRLTEKAINAWKKVTAEGHDSSMQAYLAEAERLLNAILYQ